MTPTSTSNSSTIFENGKLKAGAYKIQNFCTEGYVDIHEHSKEMCCRPAQELQEGRGIWEIKPLGAEYTIQRVEQGKPGEFCAPMVGLQNGCALSVAAYPASWRVEVVNDDADRGPECVSLYWGITKMVWDTEGKENVTTVVRLREHILLTLVVWKLIPVKTEGTSTLIPVKGT